MLSAWHWKQTVFLWSNAVLCGSQFYFIFPELYLHLHCGSTCFETAKLDLMHIDLGHMVYVYVCVCVHTQGRELLHIWAEWNKHTRTSVSDLNLLQHSHAGICTNMHFITQLGDLGFCWNILCKNGWLALYKHGSDVSIPLICPWILGLSLALHKIFFKCFLWYRVMLLFKDEHFHIWS